MSQSYASLVHFQEGWSSLQRHSRAPRHTHRELTLQTGRLGKLQVRITSKMGSKNLQITSDCGSWARGSESHRAAGSGVYFVGVWRISFWTRQFNSSATYRVFSEGQAIS